VTGVIDPVALSLVDRANSYTEITVSGTGLRIIGNGSDRSVHTKKKIEGSTVSIEVYRNCARYITVSGMMLAGSIPLLADIDKLLDDVVAELNNQNQETLKPQNAPQQEKSETNGSYNVFMEASLPPKLLDLVGNGVPETEDRSAAFHHTVKWLKDCRWSLDDIIKLLSRYPNGIARKYGERCAAEAQRCYGKPDNPNSGNGNASSQGAGPANPFELHWHGEIDTRAARPMLVKRLIPATGVGLISGQWGTAKTFTAIDLAGSVLTGLEFAGRRVLRQGGVLFIAAEGAGEIPVRLQAMVDHKLREKATIFGSKITADIDRLPFVWIDETPNLQDNASYQNIVATAQTAAATMNRANVELVLILIDTLSAAGGFNDQNAAAEAQLVMNRLSELGRQTGAFVLAIDHYGKDVTTGTRGSSAKEAASDIVLALLGDRDENGQLSNTRMAVRKMRGGSTGAITKFDLVTVEIGETNEEDGDETSCIIDWKLDQAGATDTPTAKTGSSKGLRYFLQAVEVAIIDHGKEMKPFGSEGPLVRAVDVEHIEREFKASYPGSFEAKRKQYGRALNAALERRLIASRTVGAIDVVWQCCNAR
jgi:hypothetical protein